MKEFPNQETGNSNKFCENDDMRRRIVKCQRLAMLGRLSALVTHEVNNQLTGVSGYAQLMLDNADAAQFEKELGKINTSALRCQKLIREMRQLGRFVNGNKEVGNINLILESCLEFYRHHFKQKSHVIAEDFSPDIPSGEFDTPAVEQVFLNVIQNSLEAFPGNGGRLDIKTCFADEKVVVTFEDNGPGLSETAQANLFTPFFTTKEDLNCSGLGLAAAEMVMKAHEGTITVENSPAGGTRVEIVFPVGSSE